MDKIIKRIEDNSSKGYLPALQPMASQGAKNTVISRPNSLPVQWRRSLRLLRVNSRWTCLPI
mgnify:CR=1 FL=1